ncbi:type 1 periplasmic binding fold superfamily protein [Flavobacterium faecale]|uniref:type 1 periplasmic binding fold superfamily protein n=1 Tax=Flavobacterium faecale TaxID=1355330 RepID=UPI003AAD11F0
MKTIQKSQPIKSYALAMVAALTFFSCSNDDNPAPPVNEEELITTVTAVYTPVGGGTAITLQYKDLDGEGANAPVITVSGNFEKNKTYNGVLTFKNELANPAEDITPEIIAEGTEHQVFYQTTGTLNVFTYSTATSNFDSNGKPVGLQSVFTTTGAATDTLTITLKHGPNKTANNVASGDITNAGGSTDAQVSFTLTVL